MSRTPTKPTANTTLNAESLSACFSPKIGNKASISALIPLIQNCASGSRQCNKARKGNKKAYRFAKKK